jgi:hypothetical protein
MKREMEKAEMRESKKKAEKKPERGDYNRSEKCESKAEQKKMYPKAQKI